MYAKSIFVDCDSSSRRLAIHRSRFARSAKLLDMKDAKVALDIIIRPSLQLWKLAPGRNAFTVFRRPPKSTLLSDNTSSTSSITLKKVRFDEKPVTISRKGFFERCRKDSSSSPARPCLVIRESDEAYKTSPEPLPVADTQSIYEDCLSNHPCFAVDLQVLEGDEQLDTRRSRRIRRSEFYEMESGIAMFDRAGYANYCLSNWLDRKREETRAPMKLVFEDPALLPWPSRALPPPPSSSNPPAVARPVPPTCRPPRSLPWRIYTYIEDELHNAVVVLIIGLFIHICLFLFLVYDILARGFIPSDD